MLNYGTEFWVPNTSGTIVIETAGSPANVVIEDISYGTFTNFAIPANSVEKIGAGFTSGYNLIQTYGITLDTALYISSDVPVTVRYFHRGHTGGGATLILPEELLGTEYTVSTHHIEDAEPINFSSMVPHIS